MINAGEHSYLGLQNIQGYFWGEGVGRQEISVVSHQFTINKEKSAARCNFMGKKSQGQNIKLTFRSFL